MLIHMRIKGTVTSTIFGNTTVWEKPDYWAEAEARELEAQPCLITAFFENEKSKPPWLRATGCLIACPCPRHRVIC